MDGPGANSQRKPTEIKIPQSFLDMPRWWTEGQQWLVDLPQSIERQCSRWGLDIDGEPAHGSNAVVVPVTRDGDAFVLRMTLPGPDVAEQIRALRFWDGRGTVHLFDADSDRGAMLLERLDMGQSLRSRPVEEAMDTLGRMIRRLAVPAPTDVPSTASIVQARAGTIESDWHRLGRPFDRTYVAEALDVATGLSASTSELAVNGDLHSDQVLQGTREAWLTVDPVLLRGDIAYDLARVLWTRIDELNDAAAIVQQFETAIRAAELDRDHARAWVVFRTIDYRLWCLDAGLTEDPSRCHRLVAAFVN